MIEAVLQAMEYRYACHQFEPDRSIPPADLDAILAAARLAPSSWGMEHWRFIVTEDAGRKLALQQACYNQPQLGSASVVITLVARVADLAPDTAFVQRQVAAQQPTPEGRAWMQQAYASFLNGQDVATWSQGQCHYAASFLMIAAAACGVDSCPIGGYQEASVAELLGVDLDRERIALLLPLGYRAEAQSARHRLPMAELVERR